MSLKAETLIEELEALGAPHPVLHASGRYIWVNPYFLSLEKARELIASCKEQYLTYKDVPTELIREYAGFGKYE